MNKSINLTINKPCSEKFDEFQATSAGGFCNLCQKEVIDFTNMSDSEVLAYFKNGKQNTCGRFRGSQLKTYSLEPTLPKGKWNFKPFFAGLISFSLVSLLSTNSSYAQQQPTTIQKTQKENDKKQNKQVKANEDEYVVRGIVIDDEYKFPLPGVNVVLKGSMIGIITDTEGKFRFPQPLKNGDILIFSFVGFVSQEIIISKKNSEIINITLKADYCEFMGEVTTNEVYTSKRSFWQKIKGIFR
ncbi:MAG: carboxypeptidase-like regulatory domain-containing protein [Thermoflexibacter sp.]|jgi:hypothetical protein|nr:carboxypeptidase-like regulatory domain-containing protein [Thermoflexibacter sp.]